MTYCRIDRTAQTAMLLEEDKIDFSVYNLANFTKHVFANKVLKIKKVYCRIDPRCQKATLLEEAHIQFSDQIFKNIITFLSPKCRRMQNLRIKSAPVFYIFKQLHWFQSLQPSHEVLSGIRIS